MVERELEPKIRIVSGPPLVVEHELNRLLESYAPLVWNFQPNGGEIWVVVVLVHERELRMQQLASARLAGQRQM